VESCVGDNIMIVKDNCTGCSACKSACPTKAISMKLNERGFYEPAVCEYGCIHCNKCLKVCPVYSSFNDHCYKAYYGWNTEKDVLFRSSSGGAFYSIASYVIERGGVVYGAVYSQDYKEVLFKNTDEVPIYSLQKSKYVVSNPDGVYERLEPDLRTGRIVLFTGTPCQCAGVSNYFRNKYDNLITCDFICGGMPSLTFYQEHISMLEHKYKSKVTSVDFRPKKNGWGRYHLKITFENGKEYFKFYFQDSYYLAFLDHASIRESCDKCTFSSNHYSDITIGDFWGYRAARVKKRKSGISLFICNTSLGAEVFKDIRNFVYHSISMNYVKYALSEKRQTDDQKFKKDCFFSIALQHGYEYACSEFYEIGMFAHIKNKVLERIPLLS